MSGNDHNRNIGGRISIWPPDFESIKVASSPSDVIDAVNHWLERAMHHADVRYFSIYIDTALVGQIVLHDINLQSGEGFVAYHLFDLVSRGKGIGTQALRLIQDHVSHETALRRLYIGTTRTNTASQRVAEKCHFALIGTMQEDPGGLMYRWEVPRSEKNKTEAGDVLRQPTCMS